MKFFKPFLKPFKNASTDNITQIFHQFHKSIDWLPIRKLGLAPYGTPLVAPERCTIGKIYGNSYTPNDTAELKNGYGLWMKGESGYEHQYWHTHPFFPVRTGDIIEKGQIVAYVGNSGNVFSNGMYVPIEKRLIPNYAGTHLHHSIVKLGVPYDPLTLLHMENEPSYGVLHEMQAIGKTLKNMAIAMRE